MNRIVLVSLLTLVTVGCSAPDREISQTPVQKPVAVAVKETTTESAPVETTVSNTDISENSSHETIQAEAEPVKPIKTTTSKSLSVAPTAIKRRETIIERSSDALKRVVVYQPQSTFVSPTKLVANISKNIGCGAVDKEYKAQVMAMVIASDSPKAVKKLTERQFYQAVRQTIAENQAQANDLVAQYREANCSIAFKQQSKTQTKLAPTRSTSVKNSVVSVQSGNCKDLKAQGIKNIDVFMNPWASRLDRDKDGIACEAN
ncbi:hypothetical protein DSM106972_030690 [Dulcicalothrix desertica PCC 7102]|uniref:Excalibur calcium-binding domain-containing protein n=1 Tax=Dulcicalothrix desertica PCC 7102 TaxID=232991 RepID=A0A433VLA8_9CYAN|nr:excalibur calcium-binding domain-containing protein [Dulcicalothrix desertica]RUT06812.1 hypothetical protein DSM106972_030690 [Dulcicalothrix desertica PCC 7102]TWH50079.1 excalibur calcium-binding domain-containing protein [Dulcicalothrix desertica PCC 7102]